MKNKGSGLLKISLKYLRHQLLAKYRRGHGVHSPYAYKLIRDIIFNKAAIDVPDQVIDRHTFFRGCKDRLRVETFGAGSRVDPSPERTVAALTRHSSVRSKYAELLYRLVQWYEPALIIELGTGLGISTMYMHAASPSSRLISIEGSPEKSRFAKEKAFYSKIGNITFHIGEFDSYMDTLKQEKVNRMLVFIDGDHRYHSTIKWVDLFTESASVNEVFIILDDIYWSDQMEAAWKECISDSRVDITLDLFQFGLLIRRPGISRQHYRVKF